jgi:hypothetical protein
MLGKGWVRGHLALRQGLMPLHPAFPQRMETHAQSFLDTAVWRYYNLDTPALS